jgi:hypothetical protein
MNLTDKQKKMLMACSKSPDFAKKMGMPDRVLKELLVNLVTHKGNK